jgi:hypothetical protein
MADNSYRWSAVQLKSGAEPAATVGVLVADSLDKLASKFATGWWQSNPNIDSNWACLEEDLRDMASQRGAQALLDDLFSSLNFDLLVSEPQVVSGSNIQNVLLDLFAIQVKAVKVRGAAAASSRATNLPFQSSHRSSARRSSCT